MEASRFAINSVSTGWPGLEETLDAYAAAGFRKVEFALWQVRGELEKGRTAKDVRKALDGRGLKCLGGFETHLAVFAPADEKTKNHARIEENAYLLGELGATGMVVGTDGPSDPKAVPDVLGAIAAEVARVACRIAPTGVSLLLEFNWSPVMKSLRTAAEIARRAGESNVGLVFDPAHYHCTPTKLDQLDANTVALVRHVHVDDMADKPGELSNCNTDRVLPGKGILDLATLFGRLEALGYRGDYSIEMFDEGIAKMPVREAAKLLYDAMTPLKGMGPLG